VTTDTIILSAAVAGGVSLVGLVLNLFLARQLRRAAADQLRFTAALRQAERSIQEIRGFTGEADKLRRACWHLLTDVCALQKSRQDNQELLSLLKHENAFAEGCTAFFQSFAIVQAGVPDTAITSLRDLRQQCKTEAEEVLRSLADMRALSRHLSRSVSFDEILYNLRLRLENLLSTLDRLAFTVLMARDTILVDAWVGQGREQSAIRTGR
jgi:hypothetical protein